MSTYLVTGGAGFIGTHLCRRLAGQGHSVRVLDLKAPATPVAGVEYVRGDARNAGDVSALLAGVDGVYHYAATVSVPLCQLDPVESYSNNFSATLCVLEAIRREKRPIRLVFASTAALYGDVGNDGRAVKESEIASQFPSFYAAQKHASEQAIQLYLASHGIPAVVFRFFNVYGPGQDPSSPYSGVISIFAKFAREGRALPLNGGGTQTRDFISVHDLITANVAAQALPAERWDARPINLGTSRKTTVRALAEEIVRAAGSRSELVAAPSRDGDVLHSLADISRARETLGFAPSVDLKTGLDELLNSV